MNDIKLPVLKPQELIRVLEKLEYQITVAWHRDAISQSCYFISVVKK